MTIAQGIDHAEVRNLQRREIAFVLAGREYRQRVYGTPLFMNEPERMRAAQESKEAA